jgi:ribosomal protein S18 acetylase RimI-like enzyme
VNDWSAGISGQLYADAMARGEVFFVALPGLPRRSASALQPRRRAPGLRSPAPDLRVLGFSSHRIDGTDHGTAVYVRGSAARLGIGSALFRAAEASAIAAGATSIDIDASLAAVEFYKAHGFEEVGRGIHPLPCGRSMACVFMKKDLTARSS